MHEPHFMPYFNPKLFNPLYWHLKPILQDPAIRFIFIEGGSSAAKTHTICQTLLIDQYEHEYSSIAFRRQHVDIKDSIFSSFNMVCQSLELKGDYYTFQQDLIKSKDGKANIRFRGLDDEENIKGIEAFDIVYLNEWSQFTENQWSQLRKRLRGRKNQKFICDWNPISSKLWQYENWLDRDMWQDLPLTLNDCPSNYNALNDRFAFKRINAKGDSIWLKVTYRDNFWIIGHPLGGGFIDSHTLADFEYDRVYKPNLYRIYANGERGIIRTGGEFWHQFNEIKHVRPVKVEESTIHISCDQNAMPYVTISAWQYNSQKKIIRQINEFPCKNPNNNAVKSAGILIKWLNSIDYKDTLFVYGDPSGNSANTIDENNRSFYDKFNSTLEFAGFKIQKRIGKSHVEVSLSADFINDIYEHNYNGYSIEIGDNCSISIDDYISAKQDENGKMLKTKVKDKETGISYEPIGHFSDAKRYFITSILKTDFDKYKTRTNKAQIQIIR